MTTYAEEILDRALRLEKWLRDEVERFLLLEKLGRVDVLKHADGNTEKHAVLPRAAAIRVGVAAADAPSRPIAVER
jgi:hypothetical protein